MKIFLSTTMIFLCLVLSTAQNSTEMYGRVTYKSNGAAASGVVLTIGNYSVTTDNDGRYRMTFLKPGPATVGVTPPRRATRTFRVNISSAPTEMNFPIDW